MDFKKVKAANNTKPYDLEKLEIPTGNLYESLVIIGKRAEQIAIEMKQELDQKLNEFASYTDNLEEIFENREQIEISRFYERLPKPTAIAIQEFLDGKIKFKRPEKESDF